VALQPRRLFIDVESRQFVSSPVSSLPTFDPVWIDEDVEIVELYALRPSNESFQPYRFVDLSGATVKFAVGTTTPAALQTAWTALSTAVTTTVTEVQVGGGFGGTVDEIQRITFSGAQAAAGSYALKFPQRTVTGTLSQPTAPGPYTFTANNHGFYDRQIVTQVGSSRPFVVRNASQNALQLGRVDSDELVQSGVTAGETSFISAEIVTPAISYSASIAQVQEAIVAAGFVFNGIPQVIASGENGKEITLYYAGRNGQGAYPNVVIVNSSLRGAPGVTANVSYNTEEIAALVAAGTTNVTLEIEISEGAVRQTFRRSATLSPDLITSTSPSPLPANVATSFDLQSPDGGVWTVTITDEGELKLAKQ
jgi:hypothetical protein